MIDEKPCPFCGDESEYLRFLDLCAERANEIWRENEVKVMTGVYNSMDFVQVVRCRDCKRVTIDQGDHDYREPLWCGLFHTDVSLDGFCYWGERR